jgi:predicted enzyme related to lactoylglutathione lyase
MRKPVSVSRVPLGVLGRAASARSAAAVRGEGDTVRTRQEDAPATDPEDTMDHTHHALDYVELGASDLAASQAFYEAAFGWRFTSYGPEYAGFHDPARTEEAGGLTTMREPGPGGPLVLLFSEDLDATVAAVRRAGGEVVEPPAPFPGGRRFSFADPGGNVLGVWAEQ